jgi:hypothetical protein
MKITFADLLTENRLKKYSHFPQNLAVRCHLYNTQLCESFYSSLSYLEILLRNKIDLVFSEHFGANWIFDEKFHRGRNQKTHFDSALRTLTNDKKDMTNKNNLIAELPFGFWTAYFDLYDYKIWSDGLLFEVFDSYPGKKVLNLNFIRRNLNDIRRYRNKVFHYGSIVICSESQKNCRLMHRIIFDYITAVAGNSILERISKIDTFNNVYLIGIRDGFLKTGETKGPQLQTESTAY